DVAPPGPGRGPRREGRKGRTGPPGGLDRLAELNVLAHRRCACGAVEEVLLERFGRRGREHAVEIELEAHPGVVAGIRLHAGSISSLSRCRARNRISDTTLAVVRSLRAMTAQLNPSK